MKRISIADVEQEATKLGIRADRQRVLHTANPTVAHFERMQEEAMRNAEYESNSTTTITEADPQEVAQLIRDYGNMGMNSQQIRESLANIKPNLSDVDIEAALFPEPPARPASRKGK
jgi:hypothetical protein